jgi:hypothetical protein
MKLAQLANKQCLSTFTTLFSLFAEFHLKIIFHGEREKIKKINFNDLLPELFSLLSLTVPFALYVFWEEASQKGCKLIN